MSQSDNHLFPKILKATSSPTAFAHYLPKFLAELSNPAPLSQSAKASDESFLDAISEIITSKSSKPFQKFHCLYLLLKITELSEKDILMTRLAANDELIRYIFHISQTEIAAREVYFNERGRCFFGKNGTKIQQQQGINFVRLAYEILIYWADQYGNADSNHGLYIYHFLGESLKKKCKLPLRFQFLKKDFDVECDLSSWNFRYDDPPLTMNKPRPEVKKEDNNEGSLKVLNLVSNSPVSSQEFESHIFRKEGFHQPRQTSGGSDKISTEDTPRKSPMNLKVQINSSLSIFEEHNPENLVITESTPKINILQASNNANEKQTPHSYKLTISQCELMTPEIAEKSLRKSSRDLEMDLLNIGENIKRSFGSLSSFNGSSASPSRRSSIRSPISNISSNFGSQRNLEIKSKGSDCISANSPSKRDFENNTSLRDDELGTGNTFRMTFGAVGNIGRINESIRSTNFVNILCCEEEKIDKRVSQGSGDIYSERSEQNNKKYDPFSKLPLPEHRIPGQYNAMIGATNSRKSGDFTHVKSPS